MSDMSIETLIEHAFSCFDQLDLEGTRRHMEALLRRIQEVQALDPELQSKVHWLRAQLEIESKDFLKASKPLLESLSLQEKATGKKSIEYVSLLREIASLHYFWTGNYVLARQFLEEAESLCHEFLKLSDLEQMLIFEILSDVGCMLGDLFDDLGEHERASRQFLGQAVFFRKFGSKMEAYLLRPYLRLAQLAAQKKSEGEVESCLNEVFATLDVSKATMLFFEALCVSADCYRKCDDFEEAKISLNAAKQILERDDDLAETDVYIEYQRVLSLYHLSQGESESAEKEFELALSRVRSVAGENSATEAMFFYEWALTLMESSVSYLPEVEEAFWHALDCVDKGLHPDHPKQVRFLGPYADYLRKFNKPLQAAAFWERREQLLSLAMGRSQ